MKKGFTLIEILVVILIIGIMASIGLPRVFSTRTTNAEQFVARFNALVAYGVQQAIAKSRVEAVFLNLLGKKVELMDSSNNKVEKTIDIPKEIEVTNFFLNGVSQFDSSGKHESAWFYINDQGITQEVKIVFTDKEILSKRPQSAYFEMNLNPFTALFTIQ